jgi:hypothetical protein
MPNAAYSDTKKKNVCSDRAFDMAIRKGILPLPTSRSVRLEVGGSVLALELLLARVRLASELVLEPGPELAVLA